MKPIRIMIMIISILTLFCQTLLIAQEKGGCDLCGPASGTNQNKAMGNYSATIGASCESSGSFSLASGYYAKTIGAYSVAMGRFVKAKATNSVVIGSGTSNADDRTLINNIPNSLMVGFNSSVPTLFVSNSSGFNTTGKVGIGCVISPKSKLHVKSDINEDAGIILEPTNATNKAYFQIFDEKHEISVDGNSGMSFISKDDKMNFEAQNISLNAKVAINTTESFVDGSDYTLAVSGGILTTEVLVKEVTEWYDFVFEDDYRLISLSELERFIDDNGHLPDIPSEKIIVNEGYGLVEMDGLLLKKIEELTLYTIELSKQIESQQKIINDLLSK